MSERRYAYGPWRGGPDPLAPPIDLRPAVQEIGREVMEGASPEAALRETLRRGAGDTRGLDELSSQVWQRRARIQRRHRLDGTLREARELLDRAVRTEREVLATEPGTDARFAEARLDALPTGTAAAVSELGSYEWSSAEAEQDYQRIRELLGRELMESRFAGMKEALEQAGPAEAERIRGMLADLNDLLLAHLRGADTRERFDEFMRRHGDFFPENPRDTEELVDALAQRSAAAQRALNSMTDEQRAELGQLMNQAFGDPRLAEQMSTLDANLRALRPDEDWRSAERFRGQDPLGFGEGAQAMADLAELDQLAEQLGQGYPGARLEDVDPELVARQLGERARVDAQRLSELERQLREHGVFERAADGSLRLSPKALRRLGETALRDVLAELRELRGQRDSSSAGASGEPTGASRPWQFGDSRPWDVARTVRNSVLRRACTGEGGTRLDPSDVEVAETEHRGRAAVALCVDTSWSMVAEGRWLPMKRTALALHQLISTRFRDDALQLITFGRHATSVDAGQLLGLDGTWEQGTNLHHALLLAGRHVRRHPQAQPVVLVITDGEPTAHLEPDGVPVFEYPPLPETLAHTLAEVDALRKLGASMTVFRLGDDPRLTEFVDLLGRRAGGKVLAPETDGLGAAVVGDYLNSRRR